MNRLGGAAPLLAVLLLAACARSAPQLPPADADAPPPTAEEAALSCAEIEAAQQDIAAEAVGHGAAIKANRTQNQVAGYFSAFFLPFLVATEQNRADKRALDALQARWDRLTVVAKSKRCPFNADAVFRGAR